MIVGNEEQEHAKVNVSTFYWNWCPNRVDKRSKSLELSLEEVVRELDGACTGEAVMLSGMYLGLIGSAADVPHKYLRKVRNHNSVLSFFIVSEEEEMFSKLSVLPSSSQDDRWRYLV